MNCKLEGGGPISGFDGHRG